jgi:hypothetical protein
MAAVLTALLAFACETPRVVSRDPVANYRWAFAGVGPKPGVIHSELERLGPDERDRYSTGRWAFELVASPEWIAALAGGEPCVPVADWKDIVSRNDLPEWFRPDAEHFSACYFAGPSQWPSTYLFVEKSPRDPTRLRVFVRG